MLWHPSFPENLTASLTFCLYLFALLTAQASGVIAMASVVFMLSSDFGHHALKPSGVALFVVLVTKEGVDHFVNQGALHLADIKVEAAKKLL